MKNEMIYVSSSCLRREKIDDPIGELARNGFKNIELSGGAKYSREFELNLSALKDRHGLNYILHNYFPPPEEDFILNLASLNDEIYERSLRHYERAILLSKKLGSKKFGLHAGFFIDFTIAEIGKDISLSGLYDKDRSIKRFCDGYSYLKSAAEDIELYIENNVLSPGNARTFRDRNPFMLTDYSQYAGLRNLIDFKLLLDVAHLSISANSLGLDFEEQLDKMIRVSDYVHLSDNDGLCDQNSCFKEDSHILNILKKWDFNNKTVTIETCGGISDIKSSQQIVERSLRLI